MAKVKSMTDKQENIPMTQNIIATAKKPKQSRLSQTICPNLSIEDALAIPRAIKDNFAGQATAPLLVAEACGVSPTSSKWRTLTGAAIAYGLTNGGYNSKEISLTPLGERIVAPRVEGDDEKALKEAIMKPTLLADFYRQFDNNKLPRKDIVYNILRSKGVPEERLESTWDILRANATAAKVLRVISGNEYIYVNMESSSSAEPVSQISRIEVDQVPPKNISNDVLEKMNITPPDYAPQPIPIKKEKPHIFISHGKNNTIIIGQLKELLAYGQMEPIVSVERETTAIPVPDKVFDDMRNCDAGIIHIDLEEVPFGDGDQKYSRLNENVLIEIGAAIALYGKRVILLCKKGTLLPSNLQGLYRCEYEGTQLDYAATMKLLKTMQELRDMM
ncbi:TIR domain-containing protein [Gelria sp. Kuro-4]|uniref:TIR domain-containing protein n=1 Tax=Gelria sp. Kuro-4 TaxID=2796927 RepID=UPI001BF133AE|nr:TIR domain-containing protein [Gelria sp. Kuro-4]BCV23385.1 hypothetical protein kuro4_01580 [Gelria sp. Kuro-4]